MDEFEKLKRDRPDALDFPDVPDMTPNEADESYRRAMTEKAPDYMRDRLNQRLKQS